MTVDEFCALVGRFEIDLPARALGEFRLAALIPASTDPLPAAELVILSIRALVPTTAGLEAQWVQYAKGVSWNAAAPLQEPGARLIIHEFIKEFGAAFMESCVREGDAFPWRHKRWAEAAQ